MLEERTTVKHRKPSGYLRDNSSISNNHESVPKLDCSFSDCSSDDSEEEKPRVLPIREWNWDAYCRSSNRSVLFWVAITLVTIILFAGDTPSMMSDQHHQAQDTKRLGTPLRKTAGAASAPLDLNDDQFTIVFRNRPILSEGFPFDKLEERGDLIFRSHGPDYAKIIFRKRKNFNDPIRIHPQDYEKYCNHRAEILDTAGAKTASSSSGNDPQSDKVDVQTKCREPSWTGYSFPSCNQVHELLIERVSDTHQSHQQYNVSYLNAGTYRQAWRFKRNEEDHVVVKRLMLDGRYWQSKDLFKIHREAIMLERLLPSPKVLDIYGFCGTTVLVEAMASDLHTKIIPFDGDKDGFMLQSELDKIQLDDVHPRNNFTASEKLQISLDMAESLAALHGFEGGCIIHGDTHIEQWLIAPDGSVKLNDFNNANEPEWDDEAKNYCLAYSHFGGTYRSPEEFSGSAQDESVDTFAYGNNIYTLLTGLWPHYHEDKMGISHSKIREMIIKGKTPYVDNRYRTRSFIEGKLVEIMEKCWVYDRQRRPSIFEVVTFLRRVKEEAAERGVLEKSTLIKITS